MPNLPASAPMLLVPTDTLRALHRALAAHLDPQDAARALRDAGGECGEPVFRTLQSMTEQNAGVDEPASLDADRFWNSLSDLFENLGWGELLFERLHPGVGSLHSTRWVEAEQTDDGTQPSCHFTTGLLAELLRQTVGDAELAVLEVECRSRRDAACRFLFGSAETMQQLHEQVLRGEAYADALERLA